MSSPAKSKPAIRVLEPVDASYLEPASVVSSVPPQQPAGRKTDEPFLPLIVAACERQNRIERERVENSSSVAVDSSAWHADDSEDRTKTWAWVHRDSMTLPEQGWKLHISATVRSAEEVLLHALPVLLEEGAPFKVASSIRKLMFLNGAEGGMPQIGKFITVYPADDEQAVRLALALDQATRGMHGPVVPSDRPLRPGSLVHYRYGGFSYTSTRSNMGDVQLAIRTPAGELVPDERRSTYSAPEWTTDPFVAAGASDPPLPPSPLIAGRYLPVTRLYESPRGNVYSGVDVIAKRRCILKQAHRDGAMGIDGTDARDRLRNEVSALDLLSSDSRFPTVYEVIEHEGSLVMVMEDVKGHALYDHLRDLSMQGRRVPVERVLEWALELASMLETIHDKGLVYKDLKSSNVIVTPDGHLRMIDFDVCQEIGAPKAMFSPGTYGYMSRGQLDDEPPRVEHDIYGLGALLYALLTGAEPSHFAHQFDLLHRPLELVRPGIPSALVNIVTRCLHEDPARRFAMTSSPSMTGVADALREVSSDAVTAMPLRLPASNDLSERNTRKHFRQLARRLGDSLCVAARHASSGVYWVSGYHANDDLASRDLATGSAGPVLALAELVAEYDDPRHRETLQAGARWLAAHVPEEPLPGLYAGDAGAGVALLRAGQVLRDGALVEEACKRGALIQGLPYGSPGMFNGTAGRLRFHLMLWAETRATEHLDAARACGENLLETADQVVEEAEHEHGGGGLRWRMPNGYSFHSGRAYLGYALGAAGIGDSLLDLYQVTNDRRFLEAARGAARWITASAMDALDDNTGLDWPMVPGESLRGSFWGHGASGVGLFLLRAARHDLVPGALDMARRAARSAAYGTRWAGPSQGYGMCGPIEFLLDMYKETSDRRYLRHADYLARILETHSVERDGVLIWPTEDGNIFGPDYAVGYSGVAMCLLRLGDPDRIPRQVSMKGFSRKMRNGRSKRETQIRG